MNSGKKNRRPSTRSVRYSALVKNLFLLRQSKCRMRRLITMPKIQKAIDIKLSVDAAYASRPMVEMEAVNDRIQATLYLYHKKYDTTG